LEGHKGYCGKAAEEFKGLENMSKEAVLLVSGGLRVKSVESVTFPVAMDGNGRAVQHGLACRLDGETRIRSMCGALEIDFLSRIIAVVWLCICLRDACRMSVEYWRWKFGFFEQKDQGNRGNGQEDGQIVENPTPILRYGDIASCDWSEIVTETHSCQVNTIYRCSLVNEEQVRNGDLE